VGIYFGAVRLLTELHAKGRLVPGGAVLELGAQDIHCPRERYRKFMAEVTGSPWPEDAMRASDLYRFLGYPRYCSIDSNGKNGALPLDLSVPVSLDSVGGKPFELVTNFGTLEHVFNPAAVLRNMHDVCAPNGLMFHNLPFQGQYDHGFYAVNPTLIVDLAAANGYRIEGMFLNFAGGDEMAPFSYEGLDRLPWLGCPDVSLVALLRKVDAGPFHEPFQDFFAEESVLPGESGARAPQDARTSELAEARARFWRERMHAPPRSLVWRLRDRCSRFLKRLAGALDPRT
jgi:SAM-dependent methyltransferase